MNISQQVHQFLRTTQNIYSLYCEKVERQFNGDGTHDTYFSYVSMTRSSATQNDLIALILCFDLLDSVIDKRNPSLIGDKFANKYRQMDRSDAFDHILGEIFRALLVLRNSFNHNKTKIEDTLSVDYINDFGKRMKLTLDYHAIDYLKTLSSLIYEVSESNSSYDKYFTYGLYKKLLKYTKFEIEDQFSIGLVDINIPFSFFSQRRYQYETPYMKLDNEKIYIAAEDMATKPSELEPYSGYDFVIHHDDNKYIIPKEAFNECLELELTQLHKWKVS